MRELAQYVEQDDALIGVLSVRETIEFAAKLRYVTTKRVINKLTDRQFTNEYNKRRAIKKS